jgi:3-phenylpropionate/trans-cinnamate dioxygenase ferredoxin reductase subunit
MKHGTIIIGAGQAGAQVATSLRQFGYDGPVTIFGEEPVFPYQRPPLSKAFLAEKMLEEELFIKPEAFWEPHNIDIHRATNIQEINVAG